MSKIEFTVHAGPHPRRNCPVLVELPVAAAGVNDIVLTTEAGENLPAQMCPPHPLSARRKAPDKLRLQFTLPQLEARASIPITAELKPDAAPPSQRVALAHDRRGTLAITVDGELLTIYRYLGNPARPCFFPLLGPGGKRLTRSYPVADDVPGEPHDHIHHRSLWVAHGDVNKTDNWSEAEGHGFQVHRDFPAMMGGPVCGWLAASNDWTDHQKRKILEDRRVLTAYTLPGDGRIFDLDICFTATECDVRFGDTKEGGIIAVRVAPSMDGDHGGRIENSHGALGEAECWGRRAQWCDYSGDVEGERLGIAIFDHPSSFRHPTFWHVRNYGMYTANPFGWHDFYGDPAVDGSHLLPRGASLLFHYRIYLHRGDAVEAAVADRYHDYANPPRIEAAA